MPCRLLLDVCILLVAAGCSLVPHGSQVKAVVDEAAIAAVADRKDFNDKKLAISLAVLCDSSLGAVLRLRDDRLRDSMFAICGSDGQSITIGQLSRLMQTLSQLETTTSP